MWIAVSPVSVDDEVKLEKNTEKTVSVVVRDQFCFPSNSKCRVKITKWTGRDCINALLVKPQVISLNEENKMEMTIENPYYHRSLKLEKYDKIGCLSILSIPVPRGMRSVSPDKYDTETERWYRMTCAVLHRKGNTLIIMSWTHTS